MNIINWNKYLEETDFRCPYCEKGKLSPRETNFSFAYKGFIFRKYVRGYLCDVCNETFIHPDDEKALDVESTNFRNRIDERKQS